MQEFLLIAAMILLYTFQSLFSRLYTSAYPSDTKYAPSVFAIVCGAVVCVVSLIFGILSPETDFSFRWETLVLGLANAVILYGYDEFIIKASASGPYSVLMVFNLGGGIILPALIKSVIPYTNGNTAPMSYVQIIAVVIICIAVYLASYKEKNTEAKATSLFIPLCLCLGICNGLYGSIFDVQDQLTGAGQKQLMVIYTFAGAAIIAAVRLLFEKKSDFFLPFKQTKTSMLHLMIASIVSALAINVLVLLVGVVDLTVLYTFDNAGVMLLSAIAAAILFKEKLSKINIIGCVLMTLGLLVMGASGMILEFLNDAFAPDTQQSAAALLSCLPL